MPKNADANRYKRLAERIFFARYNPGDETVLFRRDELAAAAEDLNIELPKNLGDVIYSLRYRIDLPASIRKTEPKDREWIIEGTGKAEYAFRLVRLNHIVPNPKLAAIKIPDATPEIVGSYSLSDEQALLAKIRYNRLLDIFLGIATYSLQSHLRTSVREIGQIEIDEIYVGVDKRGRHFVLPVQAKGGNDRISVVQAKQDIRCCENKYPGLTAAPSPRSSYPVAKSPSSNSASTRTRCESLKNAATGSCPAIKSPAGI